MKSAVAGTRPHTSASPSLESRRVAVSGGGVERIRFETRNISGRKGTDFPFLRSGFGRSGERSQSREERQGGGQQAHLGSKRTMRVRRGEV